MCISKLRAHELVDKANITSAFKRQIPKHCNDIAKTAPHESSLASTYSSSG